MQFLINDACTNHYQSLGFSGSVLGWIYSMWAFKLINSRRQKILVNIMNFRDDVKSSNTGGTPFETLRWILGCHGCLLTTFQKGENCCRGFCQLIFPEALGFQDSSFFPTF